MSPRRPADRTLARVAVELGSSIHDERTRRAWTLRELAGRAGVSPSLVHALESGQPGSLWSYARIADALGLRLEFALVDPRRRDRPSGHARDEDPVHAAMGEVEARHLLGLGFDVSLDEPFQHFQFAGRADLVAWSVERRALLHIENRTRFPNLQEAYGSFNAKRAYLAATLARRLGLRGGFASETHAMVGLWSSEPLHTLRLRESSFRSVCPDPIDAFAAWWAGDPPATGRTSTLVIFDPLGVGRSARRRFVGLDDARSVQPRYDGYAGAVAALRQAGLA